MNDLLRRILFLPAQGSTIAAEVDRLHYFVVITTVLVSVLLAAVSVYFFFRYYQRHEEQLTVKVEPTLTFEVLAVGIPLVVFFVWAFIGFRQYVRMVTPPPDAMDVYVMGKKWMWKFAYPEGPNSVAVLRVPANRPVRLLMTSRDVLHSFYVPEFRIKQDVLPGRYTETWFQANEPGRYQILCTEYCGVGHSTMWGEVIAMPPDEFEAWMASERKGLANRRDVGSMEDDPDHSDAVTSLVAQGRKIAAAQGCLKCHSIDGSPHIGPTWRDLYNRNERLVNGEYAKADEGYITESMMDPQAKVVVGYDPVMPTYQGRITAPETAAIIEFIRSLRSDGSGMPPAVTMPPSQSSRFGMPAPPLEAALNLGIETPGNEAKPAPASSQRGEGEAKDGAGKGQDQAHREGAVP